MLKILHVIPSLDPADGGPSVAVPLLARAVARVGAQVTIATTARNDGLAKMQDGVFSARAPKTTREGAYAPQANGVEYVFARRSSNFYKVSWELAGWLRRNIKRFDLVHIHALFSFSSTAAGFIAQRANVPFIIRPLGVLDTWGMRNRRAFVKRFSFAAIECRLLKNARAIHFTSQREADEAMRSCPGLDRSRFFISPLAVEVPNCSEYVATFHERFPELKSRPIVLFLSRLDAKKGIELLLHAFGRTRASKPEAVLMLAGSGKPEYVRSLKHAVSRLGLDDQVVMPGFLSGDLKWGALGAATVFVLPSYSENFGIAAAEALAAGVPSILSDQVALAEEAGAANAARVVPCDANAIEKALFELLGGPEQRAQLAQKGEQFARERFSITAIGQLLKEVYCKVVSGKSAA